MDCSANRRRDLAVLVFLFGSGLSALIYQTAWFREFRLIFGASTAATAAVMAIFMAGVGWGSLLLGKRADRTPSPLRLYGHLEFLIAIAAALSPLLLAGARAIYLALGGSETLGMSGAAGLRLLLASAVLGIPTFLMGGTLPAAIAAVQGSGHFNRKPVAICYAANAAGAVTGVILSTFWLLETLGTRGTLWAACLFNALIALAALNLARRTAAEPVAPVDPAPEPSSAEILPSRQHSVRPASIYAASAVTGFTFFLMELVWYRMLAPVLGGSTFTFGIILALALLGIALGSFGAASYLAKRVPTVNAFAWLCSIQALCLAAPFAFGDRLPTWAMLLYPLGQFSFTLRVIQWSLIAAVVVLPACIVAGAQFPILISLLGRGSRAVGQHTGSAYAWNTVGAILGSLAGGFGLLPLLTAPGAWRFVVALTAALSLAFLISAWWQERLLRGRKFSLLLAATAIALMFTTGPTAVWRHNPVGAGRTKIGDVSRNEYESFVRKRRRELVWEAEGRESSVALLADHGYSFSVNGKSDGHSRGDSSTQVMGGLLGALLHPAVRDVCVIGLGTGSTAGWLAEVPSVRQVEVVELEPAIRQVAKFCSPVNKRVLENPKVHLTFNDAREVMLTSRASYDLIFSEPSNPYRAGIASLFSREFYQTVLQRLTADGLFLQWIQAYEIDGASVSSICATLASVFPAVEIWQTQSGDLVLISSRQALTYDLAKLGERLNQYPFEEALSQIWCVNDLEGLFARFVAGPDLARATLAAGTPLNTDDCNRLEFALARSVGRDTGFSVRALRKIASANGWGRPSCVNGILRTETFADRWATFAAVNKAPGEQSADSGAGGSALRTRAKQAFAEGDPEEAANLWRAQSGGASDPYDFLLVAFTRAIQADQTTPEAIEQLRRWRPLDAAAVEVHYLWYTRRFEEAVPRLVKLLQAWRQFPWADDTVVESTMQLIERTQFTSANRDVALRLYHALNAPLVVQMHEDERMDALFHLAQQLDGDSSPRFTVEVLERLEPNFPWTKARLATRVRCYQQLESPLADRAEADLVRFTSYEAARFTYLPWTETTVSAREP